MARDEKPAVVYLRMSRHLRDGLRAAAKASGCSMNAFAVQVLAAAAGDASRFRDPSDCAPADSEIERDALGYPLEWAARWQHAGARSEYIGVMDASDVPSAEWVPLVKKYDAEDPGFFVEWLRLRRAAHAGRGSADRHDGA